jgi:hypothetical protein
MTSTPTETTSNCKHGPSCQLFICRVLAQREADKAAGLEPKPVKQLATDKYWDATYPAYMKARHNLAGRR